MNLWSDLSAPVQTFWSGIALAVTSLGLAHVLSELILWSVR